MRIARVDADFGSRDGLSAGLTFGVGDAILLALARSDSQLAREAACWHSSEDRVPSISSVCREAVLGVAVAMPPPYKLAAAAVARPAALNVVQPTAAPSVADSSGPPPASR